MFIHYYVSNALCLIKMHSISKTKYKHLCIKFFKTNKQKNDQIIQTDICLIYLIIIWACGLAGEMKPNFFSTTHHVRGLCCRYSQFVNSISIIYQKRQGKPNHNQLLLQNRIFYKWRLQYVRVYKKKQKFIETFRAQHYFNIIYLID